jgi:CspA family cold shock protein
MKHFGTVKSFDETQGRGSIQPEEGGENLTFERSAIKWDRNIAPKEGQRLSYELETKGGETRAVDLQTV